MCCGIGEFAIIRLALSQQVLTTYHHTPPRVISLLPGSKRNRAGLLEFYFQGTERARIVQVVEMLTIHSGRLAVGAGRRGGSVSAGGSKFV
jgi:hypothetical protein